jgi:ribonuclease Z
MSISWQVLGDPGRDNALLARVDSGQGIERLLFDCGEGCLAALTRAEILAINHLFFSHLHMDHIGGFDSLFRQTYNRLSPPNRIWGPPETARILHHRFRGFLYNLHHRQTATWRVTDIFPEYQKTARFELSEAFEVLHEEETSTGGSLLVDTPRYSVEAFALDHNTPSLGYLLREKPRVNVDSDKMQAMGLPPGPWVRALKEPPPGQTQLQIEGQRYALQALREALLTQTPGDSLAYLTDFRMDEETRQFLAERLKGCQTVVCESQYRHADRELAMRNYHLTATDAAQLARAGEFGALILFHLSDRYTRQDWQEMLREAQAIFPNTRFPQHWSL